MSIKLEGTFGIVGMGQTGCSVLRWLLAQGQLPVLFDTRQQLPQAAVTLAAQAKQPLQTHLGELDLASLQQCQTLIVSPGIAISTPALAQAAAAGVAIIGDVELFCRADQRPRIAITGSNGKTTVTSLVCQMLNDAGLKATAIGNIGVPVMDVIDSDDEVLVIELSSFQLETTQSLAATVACYLNASADHLDRYASFAHYAAVKSTIFQGAKLAIWNQADPLTQPPVSQLQQHFALTESADWGVIPHLAEPWLCQEGEPLLNCSEMAMLGAHNQANALAALACVAGVGVEPRAALATLKQFSGLAHRCETVHQHDGVRWINDSKATNEGATLAALNGLATSCSGQLILLAGGDGKGTDFLTLAPALNQQVDALICFGQDGDKIAALKPGSQQVSQLDEAVAAAHALAKPGDIVLLSPACASLDQFPNYMVRGARFAELAQQLSVEADA